MTKSVATIAFPTFNSIFIITGTRLGHKRHRIIRKPFYSIKKKPREEKELFFQPVRTEKLEEFFFSCRNNDDDKMEPVSSVKKNQTDDDGRRVRFAVKFFFLKFLLCADKKQTFSLVEEINSVGQSKEENCWSSRQKIFLAMDADVFYARFVKRQGKIMPFARQNNCRDSVITRGI